MTEFGYTMMCEQRSPRTWSGRPRRGRQASTSPSSPTTTTRGWRPGARPLRLVGARRRRRTDRADRADDVRDVPDPALPPGGRRAEGRDRADAVRRPLPARPRRRGVPERARRRRRLANVATRHEMLGEAVDMIRALWEAEAGTTLNWHGKHFEVESAKILDLPDERVPIGLAVSGPESCASPVRRPTWRWRSNPSRSWATCSPAAGGGGQGARRPDRGLLGADREAALDLAHEQFRWFALGWEVIADLRTPTGSPGRRVRPPGGRG